MYSIRPEDLPFEEDCLRVPGQLRNWTRYVAHLKETNGHPEQISTAYERATTAIPFSYKLWKAYLNWSETALSEAAVISLYERAVKELPRFPRIWLEFAMVTCKYKQKELGFSVLDHSLRSLPITQHERIWDYYRERFCAFLKAAGDIDNIVYIWKRWLQLHPNKRDLLFAEKMMHFSCFGEAALVLQDCAKQNDKKALGMLLELLANRPGIETVNVDQIIRDAISSAPSNSGAYWNILAARAIQKRNFRTAQAIFEEALESLLSLEDFCLVFEAYSLFLETLASSYLETDRGNLYLDKLERLLMNRKLLISDVLIRLQPNNVDFWLDRFRFFGGENKEKLIKEYELAVKSVNAKQTEKFHLIWIGFAQVYLNNNDYVTFKETLEYAASSKVRLQPEDHAALLISWVEIEMKRGSQETAVAILKKGCLPNVPSFRTLTLWNYLIDFFEAVYFKAPTIDHCEAVIGAYKQIIELKLALPQTFINYAEFAMQATGDSDLVFAIYEKGIAAFGWPIAFELWNVYLPKAASVIPKKPLGVERMRDLFEHALHGCPDQYAASIVVLYCKFEEEFGLGRNILRILDSALKRHLLPNEDKFNLFRLFINKTRTLSDFTDLRAVYERAIKAVASSVDALASIAIEWAQLEASIGELVRARALFVHVAEQVNDDERLWSAWESMEKEHGDERSFKDMLRLKRAIDARHAKRHGTLSTSFVPASASNK